MVILSPIGQWVVYRTWKHEVAGSIPGLGQFSVRGLMIVVATGFIPLSLLSIVSTLVMWESSQWLGKNIVQSTDQKNSWKAWLGALAATV